MWKLDYHNKQDEEAYLTRIHEAIKAELDRIGKDQCKRELVRKFTDKDYLRKVILAKPSEFRCLNAEFLQYTRKNRDQASAYNKLYIDEILRILNYDKYFGNRSELAVFTARLKNTRTCPYCNRAYTMTVHNGSSYIMRADFDHWLPKSKYPLFALSLYNIVPTCLNCNRTIKHSIDFRFDQHTNPYDPSVNTDFTFDYRLTGIDRYRIAIDHTRSDSKLKKTHQDLKLQEVYDRAHSQHELRDLIELHSRFNKDYIDTLISGAMQGTHMTEAEVYRYLLGTELDPKDDLMRPLNKFRRDIIAELRKNVIKKQP